MEPVRNAWLAPDGTLHRVKDYEHSDYAHDTLHDSSWGDGIESQGWMHVSIHRPVYVSNMFGCSITQSQLDTLWDVYMSIRDETVQWCVDAKTQLRRLLNITVQGTEDPLS